MKTASRLPLNTGSSPEEYRTSDLYLAAFLVASAVPMKGTDRLERNRIVFIFDTTIIDIGPLTKGWINGTAMVGAQQICTEVKRLKGICHM